MAIEADKVEFTDCAFLGSQDTLYTGNSATNMYFKNCRIEGNTDYIDVYKRQDTATYQGTGITERKNV